MPTWNTAFNTTPIGSDLASDLDTYIQDLKQAIYERLYKEHVMDLSSGNALDDGWHRAGTARTYYQATAPIARPDNVTPLGTGDTGRLYINSNTNKLQVFTGSVFTDVNVVQSDYAKALNPNIEAVTTNPYTIQSTTRVILYGNVGGTENIYIPAGMPDGTELTFIKVSASATIANVYATSPEAVESGSYTNICYNSTRRYDVCMLRKHNNVWYAVEGVRHYADSGTYTTTVGNSFKITVSTLAPSGGNDGDVWIQV